MSTLEQLRTGLSRAWNHLAEGWRELTERASDALTRFQPPSKRPLERGEDDVLSMSARWGLLPAEMSVDDDAVRVSLEIPGMEADGFDIQVIGDCLVVRGERRFAREQHRGRVFFVERAYGSFERAMQLPVPVDDARAEARYDRGVLTLTLPRSDRSRARRIDVKRG